MRLALLLKSFKKQFAISSKDTDDNKKSILMKKYFSKWQSIVRRNKRTRFHHHADRFQYYWIEYFKLKFSDELFQNLSDDEKSELYQLCLLFQVKKTPLSPMFDDFVFAVTQAVITHFTGDKRISLVGDTIVYLGTVPKGVGDNSWYDIEEADEVWIEAYELAEQKLQRCLPTLDIALLTELFEQKQTEELLFELYTCFSASFRVKNKEYEALVTKIKTMIYTGSTTTEELITEINTLRTLQVDHFMENGFSKLLLPEMNGEELKSNRQVFNRQEGLPQLSDETAIPIEHGGGYFHVMEFLVARRQGYSLNHGGLGIQVTPSQHKSGVRITSKEYAEKSTKSSFDIPVLFFAKINPCYLDVGWAYSYSAAGLRPVFTEMLEDVHLEKLTI